MDAPELNKPRPVTPVAAVVVSTPTKGYRTSEFWLTAAAQVFLGLNTAHVWTYVRPQWATLIAQGVTIGLYSLSRGWAKSGK